MKNILFLKQELILTVLQAVTFVLLVACIYYKFSVASIVLLFLHSFSSLLNLLLHCNDQDAVITEVPKATSRLDQTSEVKDYSMYKYENNQLKEVLRKNLIEMTDLKLRLADFEVPEDETFASSNSFLQGNDILLPKASEEPEVMNLHEIAQKTVDELRLFAEKANVNIQVSAACEQLTIKADVERIRILFRNIIDNSIKYMNQAGKLIITMSYVGSDIFIILKDNGLGLPEDQTKRIFELNYQGSNRISGNGLGLYQAKAIVESYGGTIYAKSTIGAGMGVYIQLPSI